MPGSGFPRCARIVKTDDFSSVFNLRRRFSGQYLVLHVRVNQAGRARLGLVVGKKASKLAVHRNYMKRVLRELFRRRQFELGSLDLVIRVQQHFIPADYDVITEEFADLLVKMNRKIQSVVSANISLNS